LGVRGWRVKRIARRERERERERERRQNGIAIVTKVRDGFLTTMI
jgi:hypothetical protein